MTENKKKMGCGKIALILAGIAFVGFLVIGGCTAIFMGDAVKEAQAKAEAEKAKAAEASTQAVLSNDNTATATPEPVKKPAAPVAPPKVEAEPQKVITWKEIQAVYGLESKATELKKDELWKGYQGKWVEWQGEVVEVSKTFGILQVQVKMEAETFTSDVIVQIPADQENKALMLDAGDAVKFAGSLQSWGTLTPITLENGRIDN